MKVLLINGSPNINGVTRLALNEAIKVFENEGIETVLVNIGTKPISGCIDCGMCRKNHKCVIENDIVNEVIDLLHESDGILIGSPVYYASPNGTLISLLDRVFHGGKDFNFKVGASINVLRRGGATSSMDVINKYFSIYEMPIVSSTYWNMVYGANKEEAVHDDEGLETVRNLALNMAWLMKCIKAGKDLGINPPKKEKVKRTNFINNKG